MNIFGGMKILWIFLGSSQNKTTYIAFLYLVSFLKGKVQKGRGIFWGC